jgi:DNA-binding MurR/RpiR family transcriptional regulator
MSETLNVARSRGAKVILITRFPRSPGAALADVVLCCGSNESPLQLSSVPAKIAQLFLMDVLFSAFCRRDMERSRESRARVAEALAEKHL